MTMKPRTASTAAALIVAVAAIVGTGSAFADECKRGGSILTSTVVYFNVNSDKVSKDARSELEKIANQFKGNPNLSICSLGQADKSGSGDYNTKLAMRRAKSVADYLKAKGLKGAEYQIKTRGESFGDKGVLANLFGGKATFESDRRVEVMVMTR